MLNANDLEKTNWIFPSFHKAVIEELMEEFSLHRVTAQILISRGINSVKKAHHFLYSKLPDLYDPFLLPNMKSAVDRLEKAIDLNESILIFADNDVDGISGAALLYEFFSQFQDDIFCFFPKRKLESSYLFKEALSFAKSQPSSIIVTVDCGMSAHDSLKKAKEQKVDVIITDHHEPGIKEIPCTTILNPKYKPSKYPDKELTGVGVAFKLVHALSLHFIEKGKLSAKKLNLKKQLDLVAMGTVADMGHLLNENRILVRYGLSTLSQTKRPGLIELFEVCNVNPKSISPSSIASKIAPRLNSLGRIGDPQKGLELLLKKENNAASTLALEIEKTNCKRQEIEKEIFDDIERIISLNPKLTQEKAIFLSSEQWHPGVIPIICARLTKIYNRPSLVIAIENDLGKGSLRTIPEFPLMNFLKEQAFLLKSFGGHDYAAGLVINKENIPLLQEAFIQTASQNIQSKDLHSKIYLDSRANLDDLTFDFLESLKLLEPHGTANPPPLLYSKVKQAWSAKVISKQHLKLYVEQNDRVLEGIGFGMAHRRLELKNKKLPLEIIYTPQINIFHNKTSIQLLIKDFRLLT